jgi:membrane protein implicated in regulation of membrane protease activity
MCMMGYTMEWIYGAFLLLGVGYLLLTIVGGLVEGVDTGVDSVLDAVGLDIVLGLDGAEAAGLGCSVLAAFAAAFGAVGLVSTLSGWSLILSLLVALAVGMVIARLSSAALRYVYAGQHSEVSSIQQIIGATARVTIDTPSGMTGEIMVEKGEIARYAVKEINGEALRRGDLVEIVSVEGNQLRVRKTN